VTLSPETDKMTDTAKIGRILQDTDEIHNIVRAILVVVCVCVGALVRVLPWVVMLQCLIMCVWRSDSRVCTAGPVCVLNCVIKLRTNIQAGAVRACCVRCEESACACVAHIVCGTCKCAHEQALVSST